MQSLKSVNWRTIIGLCLVIFGVTNLILLRKNASQIVSSQTVTSGAATIKTSESPAVTSAVFIPTPSMPANELGVPAASKLRLTTATQTELETLPGIGPAKARAIIDYRQTKGFKTINDLEKVKGIGPATLVKLRPLVEL